LNGESQAILSIARRKPQPDLLVKHFSDGHCDLPLCQWLHGERLDTHCLCFASIDQVAEPRAHDDRHIRPLGRGNKRATAHFINNLDKGLPDDYITNNIRHLR